MKIELIKWWDAETWGGPEWTDPVDAAEFARKEPPTMVTVGFVLYDREGDDGWISVTDTYGPSETAAVHRIPNRMVKSRSLLMEDDNGPRIDNR